MNRDPVISSEPVSVSYTNFQITLKLGFDDKTHTHTKKIKAKLFCGIYEGL